MSFYSYTFSSFLLFFCSFCFNVVLCTTRLVYPMIFFSLDSLSL